MISLKTQYTMVTQYTMYVVTTSQNMPTKQTLRKGIIDIYWQIHNRHFKGRSELQRQAGGGKNLCAFGLGSAWHFRSAAGHSVQNSTT